MPKIFAVAGNPVLHSRSPNMFNAAFKHLGMDAHYVRFAASDAKEIVRIAMEMGMSGLNITSPFKESVMGLMDEVSEHAEKIGAVNAISIESGKLIGCNTDFLGVKKALEHAIGKMRGKKAVVLGAGGAARAAAYALRVSHAETMITNRTLKKARRIAEAFGCKACGLEDILSEMKNADVLVSCASTAERIMPQSALRKGLAVMDANYGAKTALQKDAERAGCKIIDGREWLLYQAVPEFGRFSGEKPPIEIMRKALYARKGKKKSNIALIGFMGAGKSTVGKILAKKFGMKFADTDDLIVKKAGMSIQEIFRAKGEPEFRKMEREIAERVIASSSHTVFSCGGGIILPGPNRKAIKKNSIAIWLWVQPETAAKRIGKDGERRPLLEGSGHPAEKARRIIMQRIPLYAQTADLVISTERKTPEQVAGRIKYEIDNAFGN